jgi:hypothetical protein
MADLSGLQHTSSTGGYLSWMSIRTLVRILQLMFQRCPHQKCYAATKMIATLNSGVTIAKETSTGIDAYIIRRTVRRCTLAVNNLVSKRFEDKTPVSNITGNIIPT